MILVAILVHVADHVGFRLMLFVPCDSCFGFENDMAQQISHR